MTFRYTLYSLALELGFYDVDLMLETLSAKTLNEWFAFYKIRHEERHEERNEGGAEPAQLLMNFRSYQNRREAGR